MAGSKALASARHYNEDQLTYRIRRKWGNERIKQKLRGTYAHVSSRIVPVAPKGVDEKVDEAIRRREIRDVVETGRFDEKGRMLRVGRTKGVTYRRPKVKQ